MAPLCRFDAIDRGTLPVTLDNGNTRAVGTVVVVFVLPGTVGGGTVPIDDTAGTVIAPTVTTGAGDDTAPPNADVGLPRAPVTLGLAPAAGPRNFS